MITILYQDTKLDKQLRSLRRAGKKATLAAQQAQCIIEKLTMGNPPSIDSGTITKHGEQRIKGCIKFDLGSGYRMVSLKQDGELYLLYAGSHDECHRWIENNRELPVDDIRRRSRRILVDNSHTHTKCSDTEKEKIDWEEADHFSLELDDRQMRSIFSGLIQSIQRNSPYF